MIFIARKLVAALLLVFSSEIFARTPAPPNRWQCYQYVHPRPQSKFVSPMTTLAVRIGEEIADIGKRGGEGWSNILHVEGQSSGLNMGWTHLSQDRKTLILNFNKPFVAGEQVKVHVKSGLLLQNDVYCDKDFWFSFRISWKALKFYRSAWALGTGNDPEVFNPATVPNRKNIVQLQQADHEMNRSNNSKLQQQEEEKNVQLRVEQKDEGEEHRRNASTSAELAFKRFREAVEKNDAMPEGDRAAYSAHMASLVERTFRQQRTNEEAEHEKVGRPIISPSSSSSTTAPWDDDGDGGGGEGASEPSDSSASYSATAMQHSPEWKTAPLDIPVVLVKLKKQNRIESDGYIFASNIRHPGDRYSSYLMIIDNDGNLIWYKSLNDVNYSWSLVDFKIQRNGHITYHNTDRNTFTELDTSYKEVKRHFPGHGYFAESHDFQLQPDGSSLFIVYATEHMNTKALVSGGREDGEVVHGVIQEVDSMGNVVFEWKMWDHFPDCVATTVGLGEKTKKIIDPLHINSIDWTPDGNIIASLRHMDQIIKINRFTGDVMWRLGGPHNEFNWIGEDRRFSHQHDVRIANDGKLTMYANDNLRDWPIPRYSRAVKYQLNEHTKTVTKTWQYKSPENYYGMATGSSQELSNGNIAICWGGFGRPRKLPFYTEITRDGQKQLELIFQATENSYRAHKFHWIGIPETKPVLVLNINANPPKIHFSWNGSTLTKKWRIWHGFTRDVAYLADVVWKSKFEESFVLVEGVRKSPCHFYQVEAVAEDDSEMRRSNFVFTGNSNASNC